jgi:DNA-binding transcriptional regulator YdaS (Cro superfamily)
MDAARPDRVKYSPTKLKSLWRSPMAKWDISGDWKLMQSNGLIVNMTLAHHLDGTVEGCGEFISATPLSDTDVRSAAEQVSPDHFPIIGSVTHDEVYLEELRTALRQRYRAKINEDGKVVGGVTTDACNRAYSFTANGTARLREKKLGKKRPVTMQTGVTVEGPSPRLDLYWPGNGDPE